MAFFVVQWKLGDDATLPFFILKQRSISSGALFLFFMGMPMTAVSTTMIQSKIRVTNDAPSTHTMSRYTSSLSKDRLH
jgi:hypothetical protein